VVSSCRCQRGWSEWLERARDESRTLKCGSPAAPGYVSGDGVRQQFTQKERDLETNLDYFGARYYASTEGRFTGSDPALIGVRQLLNPQDLNRYAYVTNNPLKFIDPDGQEKIVVVVETFIPQPVVEAPGQVLGLNTRYFAGDGRDVGEPGGFRTQQIITVETDPNQNGGNPLVSSSRDTGITSEFSGPNGEVIGQGQASGNSLEIAVQRDSNGAVTIHAKGDESNPLITSPGITYDLNITVTSQGTKGNATVQVAGSHDGFPGYEITASRPELQSKPVMVYSYDPRKTGATPYALVPGHSVKVNTKPVTIAAPPPQPQPAQQRRRGKRGREDED
jgi:RHS repeat-associated protein